MALRLSETEVKSGCGKQLVEWLSAYQFFKSARILVLANEEDLLRIRLFTTFYHYTIEALDSYLGCRVSYRAPLPGENWARGNDLPDGKFSLVTLQEIMGAIFFYEAVSVVETRK